MSQLNRTLRRLFVVSIALAPVAALEAQPTSHTTKKGAEVTRVPDMTFESLHNKVSNVDFYTTNYGIFGLDVERNRAGVLWPRGSGNSYIFGMGLWFGAMKIDGEDTVRITTTAYDPSSGHSEFVPGAEASSADVPVDDSEAGISGNRIFNSLDYDGTTGLPLDPADGAGPGWPIWMNSEDLTPEKDRFLGSRIHDPAMRSRDFFKRGPAIISDEDIVAVYRDNDLNASGSATPDTEGYPIGLQIEESVYSWGSGPLRDAVTIAYKVVNRSGGDLYNCYIGSMIDMDLGTASNDRTTIVIPNHGDDTLTLAAAWSEASQIDGTHGYLGIDLLETPAVDATTGFVRRDKHIFDRDEQLGGATFRAMTAEIDPKTPAERYDLMASLHRDTDTGPGDKRTMFATGPFNMRDGDTIRFVLGLVFADPMGEHPTGSSSDMSRLIALDQALQEAWDNGLPSIASAVESPVAAGTGLSPRCSAIYPNPVSESATIVYDLPRPSDVTIRLFDPIGREIDRRYLGSREGTGNTARIDCDGLASGMYLYEIRTSDGSARGALTVTR